MPNLRFSIRNLLVLTAIIAVICAVAIYLVKMTPVWFAAHEEWFYAGSIIAFLIIMSFLEIWDRGKCRECGRSWAMKRTGAKEERTFRWDRVEYQCKYCHHKLWKRDPPAGTGTGG